MVEILVGITVYVALAVLLLCWGAASMKMSKRWKDDSVVQMIVFVMLFWVSGWIIRLIREIGSLVGELLWK